MTKRVGIIHHETAAMSIAERPAVNADQAIINPLDQLRGTIHRFVVLDGLLAATMFAVVAFWVGLCG